MANPKLPKQLSEETPLVEFAATGNIYVDPSYTSEEATPATSPITGEALTFGENTLTTFSANNNNSPAIQPEDGHAIFISGIKRGTARNDGNHFFFGYNRGNQVYDVYVLNSTGGDFSVSPRVAANYSADSDGVLNVYIEGTTFGGNLMGFGSQTNNTQKFTGDYEFTIKNSTVQWFCITYGTGNGLDDGNAGNQRYGTVNGNIDLLVEGLTVTGNGAILRGGIHPNDGSEKAYIRAYIKDSNFQSAFGVIQNGVDNNGNGPTYTSEVDVDITVENTTFGGNFLMFPNVGSNTQARDGKFTITGDVNFKATNTRFAGLNMGAGLGGTGWNRTGWIKGNINFDISGSSNSSRTFIHKGFIGTADEQEKVTGTLTDSVFGDFTGYDTRENNHIYADTTVKMTGSTIGNFTFYNTVNSGGNVAATAERVHGAQKLELTGVRAGNVAGNGPGATQSDATFELVIKASETVTQVGTVSNWDNITIEAGATVRANSISTLDGGKVSIAIGSDVSASSISDLTVLYVTGDLVDPDTVIISGLGENGVNDDLVLYVGDAEVEYAKGIIPGKWEVIDGNLTIHNVTSTVLLVNSNYTDGQPTDLGPIGYTTIAKAQAHVVDPATTTIMVYSNDTSVEPGVFTEAIVTKGFVTTLAGSEDYRIDLGGQDIVIGEDGVDTASANVNVSYTNYINKVSFGNVTGTAKVSIDHATIDSDDEFGINTLDMTGADVADAQVSVSDSKINDVKLADQAGFAGSVTIKNSTITNVYGGAGGVVSDLTGGNTITNVYAEGNGAKIKLGSSEVKTYIAGSSTEGAEIETLVYNDGVTAETLIIGGNANKIGKIEATVTGGEVQKLIVGNDGDTVTGDVDLNLAGGTFEDVKIAENATVGGAINVELTGGTVDTVNGTFYGLIYGSSVTGALDGGAQGTTRTLTVNGYARVGAITNFDSIEVLGGTLNVESGDRKSDPSSENVIDINGDILNRRAIQAGAINADSLNNYGLIGVLRNSADDPGIQLSGDFLSTNFVRTSVLSVVGSFANSGEITSVGDITVKGAFSNSGQIYIRSSFDRVESKFSQEGGITLNNVDMVNSGDAAFISTGFLKGVRNLTTNRLYVTGGAEINGNITIEAGAEVAFTNKAKPLDIENGLTLTGKITMYDTSSLIVSGKLSSGNQTITVNTEGDGLIGSNVLVKAEDGLNNWTINWGTGLNANSYGVLKSSTEIVLYSVEELFVSSAFASYEDGDSVIINGKTFIYGLNAFASVEDATYFATLKGYNSRIAIINDKSGVDVDAEGFDVELINSSVGAVTAKNIFVKSDSTIGSIAAASSLTIDSSALATITDVIPDALPIVIDAADGSGARNVLVVDPLKVVIGDSQVSVLAPLGNESYASSVTDGKVFLKADANIFLFAEGAEIVDGTVDKATGDVLFAGVNAFTVEAEAAAAAQASGGTLILADGSSKIRAIAGVSKVALEYNGGNSIYGSEGDTFVSDEAYSVKIIGATSSGKVYGLNKSVHMNGDYSFYMSDSNLTNAQSAIYITGNDVTNVINGNINAELVNVRTVGRQDVPWGNGGWNEGIYLGYGSFGVDPTAPIDVNVTLRGVTSTNSGFYGIQTQPSDGSTNGSDISTSSTPKDQQVRQDINANINIKVFDSVIGGTFTVLNTNNDHWNADGASLLNTYFSSGSITVEVGNSDFGTEGNWRNIRLGASLQLGGKAIQEFNVPNTLHIVATENGTTTRAAYINEWDTIIVDATAQLVLSNDVQYSTVFGPDQPLDDAGTLTQIMINMSGYKSGTHNVITAGGSIATDANLSNITVIGDNDLTGQCQLAYAFSADGSQLKGIYIFDKGDDMYVNTAYTNAISGTKVAGQELLLNYNAFTDFGKALEYADDKKGSIIVTGGEFVSQDFHGNNVEVRGATFGSLSMANDFQSRDEVTLTVKDGAVIGSVDGSKDMTTLSTLEIDGAAQIGDIVDFDTVAMKKGVALEVGNVSGAGFEMFADNELKATSVSFNGNEKIVLDVTGFTDKGHAIISTENGISGFSAGMVELVAHDKGKTKTDLNNYSVKVVGNDLVLRNALKSDTYLNSNYTAASMAGGITLPDGSYLEYGFNAFDDATAAAANLGSGSKFTLTVTGGEITGDIKLGGNNFVMDEGTVNGTVYACVNTEDKGGFYSGKTYTVTAGTIGGFDLTAGEGVYNATKSAINLGKDVTITGNIIGGGDTVVTSEGKFTVGNLIKGVSEIVLRADGYLEAGSIDLGSGEGESVTPGTLRVINVPFSEEKGNRHLLVKSQQDIKNVQLASGAGYSLYSTGKEIYLLDLSRIYFDTSFTADIDGTILENGDVLKWNVNAFSGLANSVAATRANNATLIIQNANREANISGLPPVNVQIVDSNITRLSHGVTRDQTYNGDVSVVIKNSTISNDNSYIMGEYNGVWDHRNTLNGKLYVDVSDSTISNNLKIGSFFNAGNKTFDLNFTNTAILGDLAILRDSPFASTDTVTVNMTGVTTSPTNKWWTFFEGYPRNLEGTVNFNLKDSVLGTGNGFRIALQRSCNDWNGFSANFQFNVSVENSTVNGNILAERIEGTDIHFDGVATLNVTGENRVNEVQKFNVVNMAAGATITGYAITVRGTGLINVDAGNYEGPTKNIIWMNNRVEGSLGEIKNLKEGYLVVKGNRAVLISDGNVTNLYVDANYSSSVTGTTSSAGDILIFENDASDAGDVEHANALLELEDAKAKLTAGNKLFVVASGNVLYGTMENEDVTPFVNLVVTNGDFSAEESKIAVADVDSEKTVSGNARIELAGGSIGHSATIDPETGEVTEPAVYATIDGTRSNVGGTSEFVLSKVGGIYADVKDFHTMTVTSEARVHGTITVDALAIEGAGFLTVDGTLDTDSIHIATSTYDGASKKVLVADELATIDEAKITHDEGGELFLDRENKTLWLVSTAPGNVYFNTGYTDDINGTTFNGDLMFLNTNAFTSISRESIALRSTGDNTVYVLDGNFGSEVVDLAGIGTRKLEFQGGSVGGFKVDAGSTVSVTGTTSAVSIGSLSGVPTGEGEEVKAGIGVTLRPEQATSITSIDGVNYFRFNAANAANITVGQVDFLENGGQFIVDFAGYTAGAAATTTLLTAANGINNFLQYIQPEEGDKYSRTVMETRNNNDRLMVYYDEATGSVISVKRGNAGFLDAGANNSVNGTVREVGGVANTLVYGFNVSESLTTVRNGLADGDTIVIDAADRDIMIEDKDLNAIVTNSRLGNTQFGKTDRGDRTGNFDVLVQGSTFTARTALAGRGGSDTNRRNITFGVYDEEAGKYVGKSNFTLTDGAYNDGGNTNDNVLCITQNANVRGDTVNVNLENFTINCDVHMFDNIWNNNGEQLKQVNVNWTNVSNTGSKWMWIWDPREANATNINFTIKDSTFVSGNRDYTLGLFGNDASNWSGQATVSISGFTMAGRLSGARGVNTGDMDVAATDDAVRTLVIDGENNVDVVKMFNQIEIADTGLLTGGTVSLVADHNTGILILGEAGKDYGKFKTFINVTGAINNAAGIKFVDKTDKETEIEGYTAVLGATNVFIYKPGSLGDVFYSTQYSTANNGTAVKNADGSDTVLVFGDNAVKTMADAYTALEAAPEGTVLQIQGASDKALYTAGYTTIVNGGSITGTLFGGAAPDTTDPEHPVAADPVKVVNITVNKTATVANLTVATELSQVTGDALVTIADGVSISGAIDGGSGFVGGVSSLVFTGAATAGSIVGFDTVKLNANEVVSLTGAFTGDAITIDATDFADFSKKVLTATDITVPATGITVINAGEQVFGWDIVNDGEGKALIITSDLVKDTYANAAWTPETELGFVGDTALVWDKNAFNSVAAAASKVGEGNVLYVEGGAFSTEEAIELANDVVVKDAATIGALTTGGKLTVNKSLTATSISGISALNMAAGKDAITVSDSVALAEGSKISIDVTGYNQDVDDVVVLSTVNGITAGEAAIADSAITVTGDGANIYHAYYSAEDNSVHMMKLNTFYLSTRWEGGANMPEFFEFTGEKLIYNVNAYDRMNASGAKMVDGQKFWAYYRNGSIHTGGPDAPDGDGKQLSELHVYGSVVDRIVIGSTAGDHLYNGDSKIFVEGSTIATSADDSWLVSRVTAENPYQHRNNLYGNIDVDIKESTIGASGNHNTVFFVDNVRIRDIAATETTEAKKSEFNVNIADTTVYSNINFLGDTPMGGSDGDFSVLNINLDNVTVTGSTWAIRQGGTGTAVPEGGDPADPAYASTVTITIADSKFDANSRFGLDFNYGSWDGNEWLSPSSSSDYVFNLSNATFNGYLVAGRVDLGETAADTDPSLVSFIGDRALNVIGSNYVKNAYWFKNVNLTGDSSLQGDTLRLFTNGKINVDLTGYEGGSKYLVDLNFTYDDDGNITGGGIEGFDAKNLVVTGLVEPAEGEEAAYQLVTDLDADGHVSKIVVKSTTIKDIFVDSTFVEDDFDPLLGKASKSGDAMYYGENAFSTMVGYEDGETGEFIPGALPALQANPNAVLRVTGGIIATDTLLSNSITVDAGATLAYQGSEPITVNGVVENNGNFVIDASEFIKGAPDRVTILVADEILGKDIAVTTKTYAVEKALNETTEKWELTLVRKAEDVYVSTAWAGLEDGTEVTIGDVTAYIGFTAFANANVALSKVNSNGTVTVINSDVEFTNPIARGVTVYVDGTSKVDATVGSDTTGTLVLQSGAVGYSLNVGAGSTLTVNAGATVTGGLGMNETAKVTFAEGSTLDFNIVGQSSLEGARVTNLSAIGESAPTFTVTIDAGIKDGAYQLASGAAGFGSAITLKTETADLLSLAFGERVLVEELGAYFQTGVDDNNVLILTKEASQDVIFVNSTWEAGKSYTVGDVTVTVGENGFLTGDEAVAKAISSGATSIKVVGGIASFTDGVVISTLVQNAELANTNVTGTLNVSETATVTGKATFAPAEGKTITIDGTVAFDTALTTEGAQFVGLSNVGGATKYTLKVSGEVASGNVYLLASGAEGFASTVSLVGSDVVLAVGEAQIINGLSYKLTLTEGNLALEISDRPIPAIVYVNSTWTAADGEPVTISDTVTATMGYDAFKNGNAAYAGVTTDGSIVVLGGEVSFTSAIAKTLTVNADATLTGKATFATSVAIDGTILFDTQYAATAQITGLANNTSATTKFELVDTVAAEGTYLLVSDAAGFTSDVKFGEYTLTVGAEATRIGDFLYSLAITDNSELALTVEKYVPPVVVPTQAYVSSDWSVLSDGTVVFEGATIGYNAFAELTPAIAAVTDDGSINVVGGEISFADGYSKTITVEADAVVKGKADFTAPITINGTVEFDTANASSVAAQFHGFSNVTGTATYTLTDASAAAGTYLLATDAASFNSSVSFGSVTLTVGAAAVLVGNFEYALSLTDGTLALSVTEYVPPTPTYDLVYVNSAWKELPAGAEVTVGDVTAYIGQNAFASGDLGIANVTADGTVEVVGGEVSFTNTTAKAIVIDAGATLIGKNTFGASITINGTVAFDTAFASAEAAQFGGFSFVTGTAIYTLNAAAAAGTYLLASDAATFNSAVVFGDVTLTVGAEAVTIGDFTYALGITDNNDLALVIASVGPGPQPEPVTLAYVNSEWAGEPAGTVVAEGATIGYNAFAGLSAAEAAVTADGTVEVVGGEISFADGYSKTITVDAGATVVGTATFDKAITVNGKFAFDTQYATATAAQFNGFSKVVGTATYSLTAAAVAGTYLLFSDAAAFNSAVVFGDVTLTVGAEAVTIGDFTYALGITDNNDLALTISEVGPGPQPEPVTLAYVNSAWSTVEAGTVVFEGATVGYNAFAALSAAEAAVTADGSIEVVGGDISFADGYSKTITVDADATIVGKATFNKAITVNGTFAFDLANTSATDAQFKGFSFVAGNAKYTLTAASAVAGTYLLASDAASFNSTVKFGDATLAVGSTVLVGNFLYTLGITDNNDLALEIVAKPEPINGPDDGWNDYVYDKKATPQWSPAYTNDTFVKNALTDAEQEIFLDEVGTIDFIEKFHNYVGRNVTDDLADYAKITLDDAAALKFTVDSSIAGKFGLYQVVDGKLKSVKLDGGASKSVKAGVVMAMKKATFLEAGDYYVGMTASKIGKKVEVLDGFYNVALSADSSFFTDADNGWNDYAFKTYIDAKGKTKEDKTALNPSLVEEEIVIARGDTEIVLDDNVSGEYANWVGFSDVKDYKMFHLDSAANLSLGLQATDKAKLTLWAVSYKNGKYSVTSKGTLSVKAGESKAMKAKLIEAGDYFVSVESTNAKTSMTGAYYNVSIASDTVFFDSADYSTKTTGNGWAYDKKLGINQNLEMTEVFSSGTDLSVVLDSNSMTVEGFDNFVGHNDKDDYARFVMGNEGTATFKVTANGAGTFVVYQLNEAKKKLVKLDTIKVTTAGQTVTGKTLSLTAGEYFISMTAKDTNAKGNTYYNVKVDVNLKDSSSFSLDMPEASVSDAVDSLNFAQSSADTLALGSAFGLEDAYQLDDKSSWQSIAKLA